MRVHGARCRPSRLALTRVAAPPPRPRGRPLPPGGCFLLARKFKPEATPLLLSIAANCSNGLNLLGARHCTPQEAARQREEAAAAAAGDALQQQQRAMSDKGSRSAAVDSTLAAGAGAGVAGAPAPLQPEPWTSHWRPGGPLQRMNMNSSRRRMFQR